MIQSDTYPERHYVSVPFDLKRRTNDPNTRQSIHTRKFAPWTLAGYVACFDLQKADRIESYLKSGSGRAFAKKLF
jgi:putative endonuclease